MKLKDLPNDTNAQNYLLELPEEVLIKFKNYAGGEPKMYPIGDCNGMGFFLSPDPPDSDQRKLYPMPEGIETIELLEWDIVGTVESP